MMNPMDGIAKQLRDAEPLYFVLDGIEAISVGDRIGDNEITNRRRAEALHRRTDQDGVGGGANDVAGAVFHDNLRSFADGSGRGDHVIDHQHGLSFDVADDIAGDDVDTRFSPFIDESQLRPEEVRVSIGDLHVANVWRDNDQITQRVAPIIEVLKEDRSS